MKNARHHIAIGKLPPEMKDGRTVCLYRNGCYFHAAWNGRDWMLGICRVLGATHFCLPVSEFEQHGSGI